MINYSNKDEARFWLKVKLPDSVGSEQCWEWQASLNRGGYGRFTLNYRNYISSRMAWILVFGEIPMDMNVLHRCDNPKCVNPTHLFLGTTQDNVADRVRKNHLATGHRNGAHTQPNARPKGERHGFAKISDQQALEVISLENSGRSCAEISREKNIPYGIVWRILRKESWLHLR